MFFPIQKTYDEPFKIYLKNASANEFGGKNKPLARWFINGFCDGVGYYNVIKDDSPKAAAKFLDMAREILPENENHIVDYNDFEIMYRHQIRYEDDITLYYGFDNGFHYVVIKSDNDEKMHSVMKFK